MDYEMDFELNGHSHTAVYADWSDNGQDVYEIFDEEDNFVTDITVHPYSDLETTIEEWVKLETRTA